MTTSEKSAHLSSFVRDSAPTGSSPNASSPVVVLLHAFPFDSRMVESAFLALSSHTRVLAPDIRGLGQTPLGSAPHFFEHLVDDLAAILDSRGVARAVLAGVSMGGYLALRFSEKYPERVRGLVLAATHAAADTDIQRIGRAGGATTIERDGLESYAAGFLKGALAPDAPEKNPQLVGALSAQITSQSSSGVIANLVALATRTSTEAHLANITVPTMLVAGEHDLIIPFAKMQAMAASIANSELRIVAGAGHLVNVEAPSAFEELLAEFLPRVV